MTKPKAALTVLAVVFLVCIALLARPFIEAVQFDPTRPPAVSWEASFGGPRDEYGSWLCRASDSGFLLAGTRVISSKIGSEVILVRIDASGRELWTKTLGEGSYCQWLAATDDGGYALCGYRVPRGGRGRELVLWKTDAAGEVTVRRSFDAKEGDDLRRVVQTRDGGFFLVGTISRRVHLVKVNASGRNEWSRSLDRGLPAQGHGVLETLDGGAVVVGQISAEGRGQEVFVAKLDASGSVEWTRVHGGPGDDIAWALCSGSHGSFVVTGKRNRGESDEVLLMRISSEGEVLWETTFASGGGGDGGTDIVRRYRRTLFGAHESFVVSGWSKAHASGRSVDGLLLEVDARGSVLWSQTHGDTRLDEFFSVVTDGDSEILVSGQKQSPAGLAGAPSAASSSGFDFYVVKLEAD